MPLPAAAGRSHRTPGPAYRMAGAGQTAGGGRGPGVGDRKPSRVERNPTAPTRHPAAKRPRPAVAALVTIGPAVSLAGCDPVLDVEGAFFPSWMLCLLGGVIGAAVLRPLLARSGLEPHLGPLPLVYSCLALLISFATWLTFFPT